MPLQYKPGTVVPFADADVGEIIASRDTIYLVLEPDDSGFRRYAIATNRGWVEFTDAMISSARLSPPSGVGIYCGRV